MNAQLMIVKELLALMLKMPALHCPSPCSALPRSCPLLHSPTHPSILSAAQPKPRLGAFMGTGVQERTLRGQHLEVEKKLVMTEMREVSQREGTA